jgi:hypothetical protein
LSGGCGSNCGSTEYELLVKRDVVCKQCGQTASLGVTIAQITTINGEPAKQYLDRELPCEDETIGTAAEAAR